MTIEAYGRDARLIMRRQADYATDAITADGNFVALPFQSFTAGSRAALEPTAENPSSRFPSALGDGLREANGELRALLDFETIGWHLYGMFGAPVTTGSGPYVHTFTLGQGLPPFHTFEVGHRGLDTPRYTRAAGWAYNEMSVTVGKSPGAQEFRFGLLGGRTNKATTTLAASPVERAAAQIARAYQGSLTIDGAAAVGVTEFSARLTNGLAADQDTVNGTPDPAKIDPAEVVGGEGNLRIRFRDFALYDAAKAGTKLEVVQSWSLSASRSLTLTWHNIRLAEETPRVESAGIVEVGFPWRFDAPASGRSPLVAVLTNGRSSYAMPS